MKYSTHIGLGNHLEREIVGELSIDGKMVLESILEKKNLL